MLVRRRTLLAGLAAGLHPGSSFADALDAMCQNVKTCQDRKPPYPCAMLVPPFPTDCHRYFALADRRPFDASASDPSPVHGWWLAEASALAYHPYPEIARTVGPLVATVAPVGEDTTGSVASGPPADPRGADPQSRPVRARGYVASGDGFVLVVFCGTEVSNPGMLFQDLLVDLDLRPPVAPGWIEGRVHRGFADAFDTVWDQVRDELERRTAGNGAKVWFAGHSLGAAVATLAVARWNAQAPHVPAALYTFGSPRVGDKEFASACERGKFRIYRYVHNQDIVARVPPTLPLGYWDAGPDPVYFMDDGSDDAPRTNFWQELSEAAPQLAVSSIRLLLRPEDTTAALQGGWRLIAETFASAAPGALVDHAPIYYINYFRNKIEIG